MPALFEFHGDLATLLRPRWRNAHPIAHPVTRRASVKDVIESFGLPHTEIDRITCDDREVDFSFPVEEGQKFNIYPVLPPWNVFLPTMLRPQPLQSIRFVVDVNVGRLARYLRMAGFDTQYDYRWDDSKIMEFLDGEKRIVLTRDLGLLKRKNVQFGHYIRADRPFAQLHEVIRLLDLEEKVNPFTRCLECNRPLQAVSKEEVLHRLEPLTRKYYNSFSICHACDKIYWPGSHVDEMRQFFPFISRD